MDIRIDGVPHNWTIKKMAKEAGVTDIVIVHRLRKLGVVGVKPEGRILYTEAQAKAVIDWN